MKTEQQVRKEKLFKKISRKVGRTILEHGLITKNDRILLGLSGGKDSIILLESLADRKNAFPFSFELFVAHINPINAGYNVNHNALKGMCEKYGLKYIRKDIELENRNNNKSFCFVCSWHRRKALFDLTRELNCNKLALGHHRDDALQTLLMNMIHHGSISSMPYQLEMFEGRMKLIRPLMDLWEKDLSYYADLSNYNTIQKTCIHENSTKRKYTAELLDKIGDDYPMAKRNMFHALSNIYPEYLPEIKKKS